MQNSSRRRDFPCCCQYERSAIIAVGVEVHGRGASRRDSAPAGSRRIRRGRPHSLGRLWRGRSRTFQAPPTLSGLCQLLLTHCDGSNKASRYPDQGREEKRTLLFGAVASGHRPSGRFGSRAGPYWSSGTSNCNSTSVCWPAPISTSLDTLRPPGVSTVTVYLPGATLSAKNSPDSETTARS